MPADVAEQIKQLNVEYYKLLDLVTDFDRRLLTIKGWSASVSLVALAAGFQYGHYGLFLVAALGGLAFWVAEAVVKQQQMRFYVRMREIEVVCYQLAASDLPLREQASSPQIDWSWSRAPATYRSARPPARTAPVPYGRNVAYALAWFMPHVLLPHGLTVLVGAVLFALGLAHRLGPMPL